MICFIRYEDPETKIVDFIDADTILEIRETKSGYEVETENRILNLPKADGVKFQQDWYAYITSISE